jgi:signal peptidase I
VGNAHELTGPSRATSGIPAVARSGKSWQRTVAYGAGTVSMLILSMVGSLSLWIALPWSFLGWSPTLVTTGSMAPLVTPGDVVMIRPVAPEELTPNSVVLYDRADTGRVLHRILEQFPDGSFRTGGDANAVPDSEPVRLAEIEGAAVLAVPWIGRPSLWLHEERTAVVVAAAVVLLGMLRLAPRAFDPAFDPWASGRRVNPAEVLLGRSGGNRDARRSGSGRRLLPENLHDLVLERLATQSLAAQRRTVRLLEGLS